MSSQPPNKSAMNRLPWIVAAIAVLALVATLLWKRDTTPAGGSAELKALQGRLEVLENGQAAVGTASGFPGSPASPGASRPSSTQPMGALDRIDQRKRRTPEQRAADQQRQLQSLEAQFARDAADPVRGGQVERALEQAVSGDTMASTGIAPDDVAIDCKRHSCRIVADFARPGDAQDWALFYMTAAAQDLLRSRMVQIPRPDGTAEVRIYAERK